ncbi:GNAT family N-acetyltransferase [uncultured Dokdonia sp.]|uniref:GNAT family N-acetyltransferase n=1 Tax=uncultured Dokdonia sp. TaxID=575653 RepID=UPI00262BB044|nr:GNAT family N-acetyltransferase [uncultured Dokdonia sp.]
MEIKTLEGISTKEIVTVFNDSFADYFIPFKLTAAQLASKILADKTDLSLSVGVFDEGKLIAFILHGFDTINDQNVLYNGGTGVIPTKRGFGLTKQMYRFIVPILKEKGIHRLILEVITQNIQAITSYEKSGFKTKRKLVCYKGDIEITNTKTDLEIKELQHYNWELMESFWDIQPTWQNSKNVVNELKDTTISLGAYIEEQLVAYVIYNPSNQRIQQIVVSKDFRRQQIASTLFAVLMSRFGHTFSIINVDKNAESIHAFLVHLGFKFTLEQLEMEFQLNTNDNL